MGLTSPSEYYVGGQRISVDYLTVIRRAPFPGLAADVAGILDVARAQFSAYLAADTHAARYWIHGGPTVTQLTFPHQMTNDEAEPAAQRWVERRARGGPVVLGAGGEAKPFGADPTTESAVEARREIVADIGRYFGVPSRILNAPAGDRRRTRTWKTTRQTVAVQLRGYAGPIEDAVSELLPGDYIGGRRMRFDPVRYLQGDLQSAPRRTRCSSALES